MRIDLANPFYIFLSVWSLTLALFSFRWTSNLVHLNNNILILILGNIVSSFYIYAFIAYIKNQHKKVSCIQLYYDNARMINSFIRFLLSIWAIGSLADIIYSQGIPLIWVMMESAKDYTDFGIPSFHGVMNAFYLLGITMSAFKYFVRRKRKDLIWLVILLLWPIITLGRGILLSALVQIGGIYFISNNIQFNSIVKGFLYAIIIIILFGFLGDLRDTSNPYSYLISSDSLFNKLPSGFLWIYIYITAGINNVTASINTIQPEMYLKYSIINLLPSFIRVNLDDYTLNASLIGLVDRNLNTSTFYSGYISDFGIIGGWVGGFILQLCATISFFLARDGNISAYFAYPIFFGCIFFSPFYDLLLLLPYLTQILLALFLGLIIQYKKGVLWKS